MGAKIVNFKPNPKTATDYGYTFRGVMIESSIEPKEDWAAMAAVLNQLDQSMIERIHLVYRDNRDARSYTMVFQSGTLLHERNKIIDTITVMKRDFIMSFRQDCRNITTIKPTGNNP